MQGLGSALCTHVVREVISYVDASNTELHTLRRELETLRAWIRERECARCELWSDAHWMCHNCDNHCCEECMIHFSYLDEDGSNRSKELCSLCKFKCHKCNIEQIFSNDTLCLKHGIRLYYCVNCLDHCPVCDSMPTKRRRFEN